MKVGSANNLDIHFVENKKLTSTEVTQPVGIGEYFTGRAPDRKIMGSASFSSFFLGTVVGSFVHLASESKRNSSVKRALQLPGRQNHF